MASPTRWTWVWASSKSCDRQGSLVCCSPWGRRVRPLSNWTELTLFWSAAFQLQLTLMNILLLKNTQVIVLNGEGPYPEQPKGPPLLWPHLPRCLSSSGELTSNPAKSSGTLHQASSCCPLWSTSVCIPPFCLDKSSFLSYHFSLFSLCVCVCVVLGFFGHATCRILVPWPGIKPWPSAVDAQSPNHWTSREFSFFSVVTLQYLVTFIFVLHTCMPQVSHVSMTSVHSSGSFFKLIFIFGCTRSLLLRAGFL